MQGGTLLKKRVHTQQKKKKILLWMNKCMKQKKSANDSYAVQEINTHQLKMHLADREYSPAQTDMC